MEASQECKFKVLENIVLISPKGTPLTYKVFYIYIYIYIYIYVCYSVFGIQ
jgi:hypothetical protein